MMKKQICEMKTGLKEAANQSCSYIKDNPWVGVGASAAVVVMGLVVGFLLSKK